MKWMFSIMPNASWPALIRKLLRKMLEEYGSVATKRRVGGWLAQQTAQAGQAPSVVAPMMAHD